MPRVFIGVGSNINPERNVRDALHLLADLTPIVALSTFYSTEPEGRPDQQRFINGVVEISTDIPPVDLKQKTLRGIEDSLGRVRTDDKYAPRTIDLDVIIYGDLALATHEIVIPDPQIITRPFLAVPLYELVPDMELPGYNILLSDVAARFANHNMQALPELTELLRKELMDEQGKS